METNKRRKKNGTIEALVLASTSSELKKNEEEEHEHRNGFRLR
jgi:hypothetical protein